MEANYWRFASIVNNGVMDPFGNLSVFKITCNAMAVFRVVVDVGLIENPWCNVEVRFL